MSKLFPMFKKKGKGKEDDVIDDEPKRKGKTERVKEALLSPVGSSLSPSKASKNKKKGKGAKEKRAAVNGKVSSTHLPEEAEVHQVEDFYVDDEGLVRLGSQDDHSFVDEVLSSVEESFILEHERSRKPFNGKEDADDSIDIKDDHEENNKEISGIPVNESWSDIQPNYGQRDDRFSGDLLELNTDSVVVAEPEKDASMSSTECSQNNENIDDGDDKDPAVQSNFVQEIARSTESDVAEIENKVLEDVTGREETEGLHGMGETKSDPPNADVEESVHLNVTENTGEELISPDSKREKEVASTTEVEETSMCSSQSGMESQGPFNGNAENVIDEEAEDLHEESTAEKSEKFVSAPITTGSQDSDDDFDSAQEDWDEDEDNQSGGSKVSFGPDTADSLALEPSLPAHPPVHEATNAVLVDGEDTKSSKCTKSRGSSIYEDASVVLQDSGLLDESSDDKLPSVFEESRKVRRVSGAEKLVRKLSNISVASSDAFDAELDDLLDEELDRLSEEEESGMDSNNTNNKDNKTKETIDTGEAAGMPVGVAVQDPIVTPSEEDAKLSDEKPGSDNVLIENSGGDNVRQTPIVDANTSERSSDDSNVKLTSSDAKEGSTSGSHLSTPDENSDQIKDSGYYSLPVSPNPGAVVRASGEGERGAKEADVSFVDSEEEGMMTPPSEASTLEDKTENPKELVAVIEDDVDTSVVSESNVLYQTCCENEKPGETVTEGIKESESANSDLGKSNSRPDSRSPKQGANLKVIIPSSSEKKAGEGITSPKCGGSPTKMRYKSPIKETDEAYKSPDPVGDRFLQQAVLSSHEEAEARLAQRRAARAEARELRLRELEKQQHDQENDEEKQFTTSSFAEPSPRATVAARTSVGRTAALASTGQYSRRSSEDSTTDESALPANVREMRAELKELDEKFRKAMITNAQLDNEKSTLTYEVELIKDKYTELEETHTQLNKEHRRKCTEYEQLRKVSTKLQEEVKILRGMLQERDQLIQEYGLVVVGEEEENGEVAPEPDEFADMNDLTPRKIAVKKVLLSQEASELLGKGAALGSLDVRLKKFGEEKNDLEDQVRRLKLELEEERNNNRKRENGLDYEKAKEQSKTVNEYKFRVQKAEAEVLTLQANVARLDALSTRYKTQSEELEKSEEELKGERRKLQRELRDAQSRLEEVETTNNHLIRRFDKLKNARSTLLKDLSQDPV